MGPNDPNYIEVVIRRLEKLVEPSRQIDGQVAAILGFERRPGPKGKPLWLVPSGDGYADIPHYTGDLDAAYWLAQAVSPGNVCAITWNPAQAQFEGHPVSEASTIAIALCLATLRLKKSMDDQL